MKSAGLINNSINEKYRTVTKGSRFPVRIKLELRFQRFADEKIFYLVFFESATIIQTTHYYNTRLLQYSNVFRKLIIAIKHLRFLNGVKHQWHKARACSITVICYTNK